MKIVTTLLDAKSKRRDSSKFSKVQNRKHHVVDTVDETDFDMYLAGSMLGYTRNGEAYRSPQMQRAYN